MTVAGIIGGVSRKYTKRGEPYAQFRLEGLAAGVEVVAFPSVYEADPGPDRRGPDRPGGRAGSTVAVASSRSGRTTCASRSSSGVASSRGGESVVIDLTAAACTDAVLSKMAELLRSRPGSAPVRVRFHSTEGVRPLDMGEFLVDSSAALMGELTRACWAPAPPAWNASADRPAAPEPAPSPVLYRARVFEVIPAIDV